MPRDTDEPVGKSRPAQRDFRKANGFHYDSSGDEAIVSAVGEVDLANVSSFETLLKKAALTRKPVRIDLTHCTYLDSSLINSIMNVVSKTNVLLRITVKTATVRRVLEIVGMDKVVPIDYVED